MKMKPLTNFPAREVRCSDCDALLGFSSIQLEYIFCDYCTETVRRFMQLLGFNDPAPIYPFAIMNRFGKSAEWAWKMKDHLSVIRVALINNNRI